MLAQNKFFLFNPDDTITNSKLSFKDEIYLNNISFKYQNSKKKVLDKINLKILKGTTIGIMGTSGVGKTTLINLLPRFYDAQSGEIIVDDNNIKNYLLPF